LRKEDIKDRTQVAEAFFKEGGDYQKLEICQLQKESQELEICLLQKESRNSGKREKTMLL